MSRRASGIASGFVLLVLSFPVLMLGITAWKEASHEAGVRASQLEQARSAPDLEDRADFADYAESTLRRQQDAERTRNWLMAVGIMGVAGGIVVLVTGRRPTVATVPQAVTAHAHAYAAAAPPRPQFRACEACQWQISVGATMCPRCGHPNMPAVPVAAAVAPPPRPVNQAQRAFYVALLVFGLGSMVVIYTVLFDNLSETTLVQITPYWIFPSVFGYYGLVAQRMEARLQTTHLDNVSDQLLNVIRELGFLGQAFAFLVHAPFLLVRSGRPWVTAFAGSLIWALALALFFEVVFPTL
jgi:hypothetical protein